jgi:hypothetical protein
MKIKLVLSEEEALKIVRAYRQTKTSDILDYVEVDVEVEKVVSMTHAGNQSLWFSDDGEITIRPYYE